MKYLNFFDEALSKLVLDVFGASGAIWGTSEVLTLRNEETQELWRKISIGVGGFFLIRYTFIMKKLFYKLKNENSN